MPRLNRSEICARDEIQAFQLVNRCVRRTHLCGKDRRSGKDFSHRKQWIRNRLEELAGIFGIDVLAFAVMSNHLHVVARTRPDIVRTWTDDEVALRWWRLFPQRRHEDRSPAEPTELDLNMIKTSGGGIVEKRKRLSDISWFMRCLVEPIARMSNKEDEVTGRFWEGRFRAQPLLDETAIAACMAYVDLNLIRAGVASTPETSDYTSVQERIRDRQQIEQNQSGKNNSKPINQDSQDTRIEHGERAGWLSPIAVDPPRKKVRDRQTTRRASNQGCLSMTLDDYLSLVDWTGRRFRRDKVGSISDELQPILDRLQCDAETWFDFVKNFRKRFRNAAGLAKSQQSFRATLKTRRSSPLAG